MFLGDIVWNDKTIMFALIFGLPVVSVMCSFWYKVSKVRSDNELKQSMVQRGMSVDEIERVLNAKSHKS